jgi:streptomycin 6-kinase
VLGEPAYEVGAWLRNPYPALARWPDARRKQARRIAIFAEILGWDAQRLWGWGFAQAVLSAAWSDEDGEADAETWLAIARSLQPNN